MSDDPIRYVFTPPWDGASRAGEIQEITARFGAHDYREIVALSAGQPWTQRLGESERLFFSGGLEDNDVLFVPVYGAEWKLEDGAQWTEWLLSDGDTLQMVVDAMAKGTPIGKLIPAWNYAGDALTLHYAMLGNNPRASLLSFVWYYHRNSSLRRDTLRAAGGDVNTDSLGRFPALALVTTNAKTVWLPVIPPVKMVVPVAPSAPDAPQTGATIDVKPNDQFHALTAALRNLELQLDGIDENRAKIVAVVTEGETVLSALPSSETDHGRHRCGLDDSVPERPGGVSGSR